METLYISESDSGLVGRAGVEASESVSSRGVPTRSGDVGSDTDSDDDSVIQVISRPAASVPCVPCDVGLEESGSVSPLPVVPSPVVCDEPDTLCRSARNRRPPDRLGF